jgi:hypothetical protein
MGRRLQSPSGKSLSSLLVTSVAALFTALLMGCFSQNEDRQAGVDDFPNSIYARVQGHLGEAEQGDAVVIPTEALSLLNQSAAVSPAQTLPKLSAVGNFAGVQGMAKTASGQRAGLIEQGDSAVLFTTIKTANGKVEFDTLFFKPGTNLLDSAQWISALVAAKHREIETTTSVSGVTSIKISTVVFSDGDGDGLMALPSESARISVHLEVLENGITEIADLILDGGPDGNRDTEADNRIYQAKSLRLRGSDTLTTAFYSDANGDGIVIDNGKPTLVDLLYYERDPKDKLEVAERTLSLRLVSHYTPKGQEPSEKLEIRRFAAVERFRNGQINRLGYANAAGGEDLNPTGRTRVSLTVENTPSSDTLESMSAVTVVQPESVFGLDQDRVLSYEINTKKRLGEEKQAHFSFKTEKPAPPKKEARDGDIAFSIDYHDSTQVTVVGTLIDGAFTASITARNGTLYDASWDADGKLVRVQVTK